MQVLLSDFFAWHSVLNGGFYNDSHTEAEWNEKDAWYEALSGKQKGIETLKSWQKVFNVNAFENEFCQNGRYIQAVFWKLSKDMVTDIRYFTLIITIIWCFIWMILEILIDGYTTDRTVDNIMTLILMPFIYRCVSKR